MKKQNLSKLLLILATLLCLTACGSSSTTYRTTASKTNETTASSSVASESINAEDMYGVYVGLNGSALVLHKDGLADYYWKDWEKLQTINTWSVTGTELVVVILKVGATTADLSSGTDRFVLTSLLPTWDNEEYIRITTEDKDYTYDQLAKIVEDTLNNTALVNGSSNTTTVTPESNDDDLQKAAIGTWVGMHGSAMTIHSNGKATYFWKDWNGLYPESPWEIRNGKLYIDYGQLGLVYSDIAPSTTSITLQCDADTWDEETYIKASDEDKVLTYDEYVNLVEDKLKITIDNKENSASEENGTTSVEQSQKTSERKSSERKQRNGWSLFTNKDVTYGDISFSIPNYFGDGEEGENKISFLSDEAIITVIEIPTEHGNDMWKISEEKYEEDNMIYTELIFDTFLKGIDNTVTSSEHKSSLFVHSYSYDFEAVIESTPIVGKGTACFIPSEKVYIIFMFVDKDSEYLYDDDFEKIIDSVMYTGLFSSSGSSESTEGHSSGSTSGKSSDSSSKTKINSSTAKDIANNIKDALEESNADFYKQYGITLDAKVFMGSIIINYVKSDVVSFGNAAIKDSAKRKQWNAILTQMTEDSEIGAVIMSSYTPKYTVNVYLRANSSDEEYYAQAEDGELIDNVLD